MGAFFGTVRTSSTSRQLPELEFVYDHACKTCMEMKPEVDRFAEELSDRFVVRQYDVRKRKGPFPSTYVPAVRLLFRGQEAIVEAEQEPTVLTADGLADWVTIQMLRITRTR